MDTGQRAQWRRRGREAVLICRYTSQKSIQRPEHTLDGFSTPAQRRLDVDSIPQPHVRHRAPVQAKNACIRDDLAGHFRRGRDARRAEWPSRKLKSASDALTQSLHLSCLSPEAVFDRAFIPLKWSSSCLVAPSSVM